MVVGVAVGCECFPSPSSVVVVDNDDDDWALQHAEVPSVADLAAQLDWRALPASSIDHRFVSQSLVVGPQSEGSIESLPESRRVPKGRVRC